MKIIIYLIIIKLIIIHYSTKYCLADYLNNNFTKIQITRNNIYLILIILFLIIINIKMNKLIK